MKIRELEERDFKGLCSLILNVYDEMPYATNFESRPDSAKLESLMSKKLEGMRDRSMVDFVAIKNDEIIGDCEITKSTESGGVIGIIVGRAHRRKGVGRRLVDRCIEKARLHKMLEVYAEIDDRNTGAAAFFERCGFKEQEGEGSLVMVRSI